MRDHGPVVKRLTWHRRESIERLWGGISGFVAVRQARSTIHSTSSGQSSGEPQGTREDAPELARETVCDSPGRVRLSCPSGRDSKPFRLSHPSIPKPSNLTQVLRLGAWRKCWVRGVRRGARDGEGSLPSPDLLEQPQPVAAEQFGYIARFVAAVQYRLGEVGQLVWSLVRS